MLTARDGYRLWAPTYDTETAVSFLEGRLVAELDVPTAGRRLLDVGCGTSRRFDAMDVDLAVGVDLTVEMLECAPPGRALAAGDVRALPIADATFDVVWCRLVVGHVPDLTSAYAELARVCRRDGDLIVTDFHPDAVAAGHRRTFRDVAGVSHELEHHVHTAEAHASAARASGLTVGQRMDGVVGSSIEPFYAAAGRMDVYGAQRGLRLVLGLSFRRAR